MVFHRLIKLSVTAVGLYPTVTSDTASLKVQFFIFGNACLYLPHEASPADLQRWHVGHLAAVTSVNSVCLHVPTHPQTIYSHGRSPSISRAVAHELYPFVSHVDYILARLCLVCICQWLLLGQVNSATLQENNMDQNLGRMKLFNARRKFKSAIQTVIVADRLRKLADGLGLDSAST